MKETTGAILQNKLVFISAGEQSGEMHGASLIKELRKVSGEQKLVIAGLGGEMMKTEGAELLYHINSLAAVGLLDVARKYSYFKRVLKECTEYVKEHSPAAVILIDYPGFNLRFAEEIRKFYNGKIIYYISPQLWAWHEKRVYKVKEYVDKMLVVFPFEEEFYRKYGVEAEYVGHPLVKRIGEFLKQNERKTETLTGKKKITLMPGSRNNEIKNHLPVLLETVELLNKEFDTEVTISKAASVSEESFEPYLNQFKNYELSERNSYELILNSDLVMAKAGTSTLECGLIGTPNFVFLKTAFINYLLLKPIVKINNIALVNIIAKENIVREFIQNDFKAENLLAESTRILSDNIYCDQMKDKLKKIRNILGDKNASYNAAVIIKNLALN
jgi:lipid-A-disaccharide synthase